MFLFRLGRQGFTVLEVSQGAPARPCDRMRMVMKTLEQWGAVDWSKGGGSFDLLLNAEMKNLEK